MPLRTERPAKEVRACTGFHANPLYGTLTISKLLAKHKYVTGCAQDPSNLRRGYRRRFNQLLDAFPFALKGCARFSRGVIS